MKIKSDPSKIILILLTLAAGVKMICCGWIIDEGYAFAIGNRLLEGDKLFADLWELHQTSGYAVCFFLGIYRFLTHTPEGEIIFVRACGMAIHMLVSYAVFRALSQHMSGEKAFLCAILYANLTPKQLSTPEFSNLFNWTSTVTVILADRLRMLDETSKRSEKYVYRILTGIFLSACVVSYPQSIVFAIFILAFLLLSGKERKKNFIAVFLVCVLLACVFVAYILSCIPLRDLLPTISNMLEVDATHTEGMYKIVGYLRDLGITAVFSALIGTASCLTARAVGNKRFTILFSLIYVHIWKLIHFLFRIEAYSVEYTFGGILFVIVIGMIAISMDRSVIAGDDKREVFILFGGGGLAVFTTVLIACDQSVFSSAKYLSLTLIAIMVVLMKLSDRKEKHLITVAILMMALVNIVQLNNPRNALLNITDADARVPAGPQKGLIMERMYANKARIDWEELPAVLDGAEFVMITGDAVTYLYTDARIGNGSTIMTEDYGERFGLYWEVYPEKKPDIIAIECYNGTLDYRVEMSWLYEYATGEFGADEVKDTTYYRLYIRNR